MTPSPPPPEAAGSSAGPAMPSGVVPDGGLPNGVSVEVPPPTTSAGRPSLTAGAADPEAGSTTTATGASTGDGGGGAAPSPRGGVQRLALHAFDTVALEPFFDPANAVRAQVEASTMDLFTALVAYVAVEAAGGVASVYLPKREWRESESMDDNVTEAPTGDARSRAAARAAVLFGRTARVDADPDSRPYSVRYHADMGVHPIDWNGSRLWVVQATSLEPIGVMSPEYVRSLFIYAPLSGTGDDGGRAGGLARITAFLRHVVSWEANRRDKRQPSTHYELYRYIHESSTRGRWSSEGTQLSRPLASVILPRATRERLLEDARSFAEPEARAWYVAHGVPYRRCYLLHGPPGTGKSSYVRALAGELRRPVAFLQVASLTDALLADAFRDVPASAILILEDLDCVFLPATGGAGDSSVTGAREARSRVAVTLAGLLNALDGLVSGTSGRLTVLTSNHPNLLDGAILRPGRVDVAVEFPWPGRAEVVALFRSFYPSKADEAAAEAFADKVMGGGYPEHTRSMAALQQLFIKHRCGSALDVVADVCDFLTRAAADSAVLSGGKGALNGLYV